MREKPLAMHIEAINKSGSSIISPFFLSSA